MRFKLFSRLKIRLANDICHTKFCPLFSKGMSLILLKILDGLWFDKMEWNTNRNMIELEYE